MRLSLVVQRYGTDVVGGAERLARGVAEGLAGRGHEVEVLTTCARSYRSWSNHYREGTETVEGVAVRRFRTEREREMESFNALSEQLFGPGTGRTVDDELAWIDAQGPYVPALVDHLHAIAPDRDRLLFFTYLYHPTVHGIHAAPDRSVLIPTAHDEAPIYLESYRSVFTLPAGLIFNTRAEQEFVRRRFPDADQPSTVAGVGIDDLEPLARAGREAARAEPPDPPVVLYAGRIEEGKGVAELISWLRRFRRDTDLPVRLRLMGEPAMELPDDTWIEPLGFVSDEDKRRHLAESTLLAAPSALESFGIVLLEANAAGTPALANAASDAYVEHCTLGGGGLWYADYDEFRESLRLLLTDRRLRDVLSAQGASYVRDRFSWDAVTGRYEEFLRGI